MSGVVAGVRARVESLVPRWLLRGLTAIVVAGVMVVVVAVAWTTLQERVGLGWIGTIAVLWAGAIGGLLGWEYWDPPPDVQEVRVSGPIARDPEVTRTAVDAGDVVARIDARASRPDVGLLIELDSPGGEIVASENVRRAVAEFDGPTVAYAADQCASGAYLIAAACDHVVAHDSATIGSIGVLGSHVNLNGLADRLGVDYEGFTAGEFKDTGHPLKDLQEREREYVQSIVDAHYDRFVEQVSSDRGLDAAAVRETEARVFVGPDAVEHGLVDETGSKSDARDWLTDELGLRDGTPEVAVYKPPAGIAARLGEGAQRMAFAFGAGVASRLSSIDVRVPGVDEWEHRYR